jgi:hypothetical protein
MVSAKSVDDQLDRIHYQKGWNTAETYELAEILLPDEEIFECVNGWYENGIALLCATNIRVLLIDKKPFKFLTVEDLRFETINQIDYSHRMMNASICITAGLKNLAFKSVSQQRLRKLIAHVQRRMAEIQKVEQSLRARASEEYLPKAVKEGHSLKPIEPAVSLNPDEDLKTAAVKIVPLKDSLINEPSFAEQNVSTSDLYEDGVNEIFGKYRNAAKNTLSNMDLRHKSDTPVSTVTRSEGGLDPLRIACSKFPLIYIRKKVSSLTSSV